MILSRVLSTLVSNALKCQTILGQKIPYSLSCQWRSVVRSPSWRGFARSGILLASSPILLRPLDVKSPDSRSVDPQKVLVKHLLYDWWIALLAIIFAIIAVCINVSVPIQMGSFVNLIISLSDSSSFIRLIGPAKNLLLLYVLEGIATLAYIYTIGCYGERLSCRLKGDVFANIMGRHTHFFDANRSSELVSRATSDIQEFKSLFKQCLTGGIKCVTQVLGSFIALFRISGRLTTATFVILPAVVSAGLLLTLILSELSATCQLQLSKSVVVADEAIKHIKTVKTLSLEETLSCKYSQECARVSHLNEQLAFGIGLFQGLSDIVLKSLSLGVIFYGGMLLSSESITPGDLTAYLTSLGSIQKSLATLSLLFGKAVKLNAAASLFAPFIIRIEESGGGVVISPNELRGRIQFNDVCFTYPGRPDERVLKNVYLDISAGSIVALVGQSGGGKSTIVSLMERLYDVESGSVLLDGMDVRDLDLKWLRGKVLAYVSQEPCLFATSIKENIRIGKPSASDEEVTEAAKMADAHEFISKFSNGYSTMVGEEGHALSGGQKQRIAIARALIKDPSVLVLDEATSALDSEAEQSIFKSLDKISKGRTVIIVAHRLSTIKNSDIIYVIDGGRVCEVEESFC